MFQIKFNPNNYFIATDVNSVKHQDRRLLRPVDLNLPTPKKPLSASGKLMANWLIKASPVRNEAQTRPAAETVKRHLPMNEEAEEPCSKKQKKN